MKNNLKIYIIHYTKLTDRKNYLDNLLKDKNIEFEYISEFDQEELDQNNIALYYRDNEELFNTKSKIWHKKANKYYVLSPPEISCSIKHIDALRKIANSDKDFGLILEDDAIPYRDNYLSQIENVLSNSIKWDALFIGNGMGESFRNKKIGYKKYLPIKNVKVSHPATNCLEAYIIKKEIAKKIVDSILPFNLVIDWELAYQFYKLDLNIYWIKKPIFFQGTKEDIYESTLR